MPGLLLPATVLALALDQVSKWLVRGTLREGVYLPTWRWAPVRVTRRTGRSLGLGLLPGRGAALALWGVVGLATLLVALTPPLQDPLAQAGLGAALGGASSNVLDRARGLGVVDFIDVRVWPTFNLADVAIVAGTAVALLAAG